MGEHTRTIVAYDDYSANRGLPAPAPGDTPSRAWGDPEVARRREEIEHLVLRWGGGPKLGSRSGLLEAVAGEATQRGQDCLIRVPLIVRLPGALPSGRTGLRVDALTESIDVFATIMELAGIEPQHTHFGRSLLPLMRGEATAHRSAVFAEGGHVPWEGHTLEDVWPEDTIYHEKTRLQHDDPTTLAKAAMVRTERWKYVARLAGKEELYDLDADPGELVNRIDDEGLGHVVADLRTQLLQWFLLTADDVPFERDSRR